MYINCGGENVHTDDRTYEGDAVASGGASKLYSSNDVLGLTILDFLGDNDFINH